MMTPRDTVTLVMPQGHYVFWAKLYGIKANFITEFCTKTRVPPAKFIAASSLNNIADDPKLTLHVPFPPGD